MTLFLLIAALLLLALPKLRVSRLLAVPRRAACRGPPLRAGISTLNRRAPGKGPGLARLT